MAAADHAAAELLRHGLHAIADAEHRHAELEHGRGRARRAAYSITDCGPAGEDDAAGAEGSHLGVADVPGMDLAVDPELANAARDELGVLRAEIEDQDAIGVDIGGRGDALAARAVSGALAAAPQETR